MFKNVLGNLQEDDIVLEVLFFKLLSANTQDDEALPLVLIDHWSLSGERDLIRADGEGIEHLIEVFPSEESVQRLFV